MNAARIFRNFLSIGALSLLALTANAALFGDDEARRAILDLRQKVDAQQQRNIEELKNARTNDKPLDKEQALKQIYQENQKNDQDCAAIAYYYAQQTEQALKNNKSFWAELKQLSNS